MDDPMMKLNMKFFIKKIMKNRMNPLLMTKIILNSEIFKR